MSKHPYDMKVPCPECPFRKGQDYLTSERAEEIANCNGEFPCHKTTVPVEDDDGDTDMVSTKKSKVCAGFLILREKMDHPNQMMRIAERLGMYTRADLMENNPAVDEVYDDVDEMAEGHSK